MITALASRHERIVATEFDYAQMPKTRTLPCNLCGSDRWVVIAHRDRYGFPVKATTCSNCGLTVINPRMTNDAYTKFYQTFYRPLVSAYHGRTINAKTIKAEQAMYAEKAMEFIAPYLGPEHRTMLDVGGSTGVVSDAFRKTFGMEVTVIDPSPEETSESQALGIETISAFIESWEPRDRKFDFIGMFQTVDHLLDVAGTLSKLRSVISDDGMLFLDIVDFRGAYLRANSVQEALKIDHVYSFTEQTMEAFLERSGFKWVRKEYAEDLIHIGYLCIPVTPNPKAKPQQGWATSHLSEIRKVQNTL